MIYQQETMKSMKYFFFGKWQNFNKANNLETEQWRKSYENSTIKKANGPGG